jgi:hypothetical protein
MTPIRNLKPEHAPMAMLEQAKQQQQQQQQQIV